jgi:hypothetical protein
MKLEKIGLPGLLALGAAGAAASALLGLAAGVAIARNPEAIRRTATRLAHEAAQGLEQATLLAGQAREHLADLWAEAREAARATVDTSDFERAAAAGPVVEPVVARARRGAASPAHDPSGPADPAASASASASAKRPATRRRAPSAAAGSGTMAGSSGEPRPPVRARTRRSAAAATAPATDAASAVRAPD